MFGSKQIIDFFNFQQPKKKKTDQTFSNWHKPEKTVEKKWYFALKQTNMCLMFHKKKNKVSGFVQIIKRKERKKLNHFSPAPNHWRHEKIEINYIHTRAQTMCRNWCSTVIKTSGNWRSEILAPHKCLLKDKQLSWRNMNNIQ